MNAHLRQAERLGRLTTELGPDILALLRFDGSDHLNDLFEYRVEALASRDDLDFDSLIGTHATVEIEGREGIQYFDGIVTQARWAGVGENGHRYDLTLRPWFWLASRRRNQRIFHNRTVVQILQELLADYAQLGDPALKVELSQDYPELEYTVQYRESDLDFARRQMERFGISFHFRHAMGSHTLVLTDDVLAHETIGARPYKSYDGHHQYEQEHFWDWAPERNITTGAIRLTDYNFKKPDQAMEADRLGDAAHAQGQIESFDYPGDYLAQDVGKIVAGLRAGLERGADRRNRAVGDCASLRAGRRVRLSGDPVPGVGETYLCLSASHHFVSEAYGSGGQDGDGYSFTGSYALMPDTAPMVPPRRTAVPVVHGPQTAVVVGEGEIDCDEYGRILVRFHWDLAGAHSMRCRVSQNWAGAGWGGMVIPRIGMEVVVEFLEGDPDKPLVTGNVFNGKNDAPYELPKHKTRSTFRTNTHNGKKSGRGFNELRFEDQEGDEEIYVHAQKDRNEKTLNNHAERIDNNWLQSVGHNKVLEVKNNQNEAIGGDYFLSVGPSSIGTLVSLSLLENSEGIKQATTGLGLLGQIVPGLGNMSVFVDKAKVETVGFTSLETVGTNKSIVTGVDFGTSAGKNTHLSTGQKFQIVAGKEFEIVCGKSRFVMLEDGTVKILGNNFYFSSYDDFIILGKDVKIN
ncbi:type VI secretion system tip protein VgrG [Paracoccus caeni]|uniref:Type VI secretion system tip protein VgrG n=1 Tax=Paracoccus caeni TaxID=657651 RepID=A0A934SKQ0_9RHOB|nr:type VI secretion system tip protein TssI/VgrG [Paracoccus caeni]MBK4216178.1 type VI secretion system tip protein VgrG [Paracoccus caeni]